jgi:hypothetical protein
MPYHHIEELRSRKNEKIALWLTAENFAGLVLVGLPIYIATSGVEPFWLRMLAIIVGACLGVAVTLDVGGMALYERGLWLVRGRLRRLVRGRRVGPSQLAGVTIELRARPLAAAGPIQPVGRKRLEQ